MLRIRDSINQEFDPGAEGTAVSSPWCQKPLERVKGWRLDHLEASSLTCLVVDTGSSFGWIVSRNIYADSLRGLLPWAPSYVAAELRGSIPRRQSRSRWHCYNLASKVKLHPFCHTRLVEAITKIWPGSRGRAHARSVRFFGRGVCGRDSGVMAVFGKCSPPRHVHSFAACFYSILVASLEVPKDVILQLSSLIYNYKITFKVQK